MGENGLCRQIIYDIYMMHTTIMLYCCREFIILINNISIYLLSAFTNFCTMHLHINKKKNKERRINNEFNCNKL